MSEGDRIIIGIKPGQFYLQPGSVFTTTDKGFDTGSATFTTHWDTPESQWPKRGDPAPGYASMFATLVSKRDHESTGCRDFECTYKGLKNAGGGKMKLTIDKTTTVDTLIVRGLFGAITLPRVVEEYVATSEPSKAGLGGQITGGDVPSGFEAGVNVIMPDGSILTAPGLWFLEVRETKQVLADPARNVFECRDVKIFRTTGVPV